MDELRGSKKGMKKGEVFIVGSGVDVGKSIFFEKEPDGYIDIPHLNAKIPFWNVRPPTLMDVNPIYISKEDREKLLKSRANMYDHWDEWGGK